MLMWDPPATSKSGSQILEPLLIFHNLEQFSFTSSPDLRIPLEDAMLASFTQFWSSLRTLEIGPTLMANGGEFQLSYRALIDLAQSLPKLKHIDMSFDTSDIDVEYSEKRPPIGKPNCQITELGVHFSTINNPAAVAAIFAASFPNLKGIKHSFRSPEGDPYVERWAQVNQILSSVAMLKSWKTLA